MATKRPRPYLWVTWLSRLMAGDTNCEWATWFRTYHKDYDRVPSDFNLAAWRVSHTRLVRETRRRVEGDGKVVLQESQAEFWYESPGGIRLSGSPDLVVIDSDSAIIYDCRTGKHRDADAVQVMIYMYCLPLSHPELAGKKLSGAVVYRQHQVDIPASAINDRWIGDFEFFLDSLESPDPPPTVPSGSECAYCDIAKSECSDRVE